MPDFIESDALFKTAFDIYKSGYPANEFVGLPVAEELMRSFDEQLQQVLDGKQTVDRCSRQAQDSLGVRSSELRRSAGVGPRPGPPRRTARAGGTA